jgi:hypothetical protein
LLRGPSVHGVELVGSRRRGTATEQSDIDPPVHTVDFDQLAAALPRVELEPLRPLAAQWDRLSEEATSYMLVLPGTIKLDLVFDRPPRLEPPWEVPRSTWLRSTRTSETGRSGWAASSSPVTPASSNCS